jgi:Ca2+-binding RTX toxin-like protein
MLLRPFLLLLAALLLVAAPASASSTSVGGGTLYVTADDGELNDLLVTYAGTSGVYLVAERGPMLTLRRGAQCADNGGGVARCTGVSEIRLDAGDGADRATIGATVAIRATLTDGAGDDVITGGAGNDVFVGSPGDDTLDGGAGNDTFGDAGGFGHDTLIGGSGSDTANYSARTTPVVASADGTGGDGVAGENDDVRGDVEVLLGGSAADRLTGGPGNDTLRGNSGDDVLDGAGGSDTLEGGSGTDTADYRARTVALALSNDGVANDGAAGENDNVAGDVERLIAGSGNDDLTGGRYGDVLAGGEGTDRLRGGDGDDVLDGGPGADTLDGGAGIDTVDYSSRTYPLDVDLAAGRGTDGDTLTGVDGVTGGSADDRLRGNDSPGRFDGGPGNDWLDGRGGGDRLTGGDGWDHVDYTGRRDDVVVSLNDGADDGESGERDDVRRDVESVASGSGDDKLTGDDDANSLNAGSGDDEVRGNGGDDTLTGGTGRDTVDGGWGDDQLTGGDHDDKLYGGDGQDALDAGSGDDQLYGGAGHDTLAAGSGNDRANGDDGNDVIDQGAGNDESDGGRGADRIAGGPGADKLWGGDDGDDLDGGDGNDTLDGGRGNDIVRGAGNDDKASGGDGDDSVDGGEGSDTVNGNNGHDGLTGSGGNDQVWGADGFDGLDGGAGNDTMGGGNGDDTVLGASGDDKVSGDDGNDTLDGGTENDSVDGGRGDDAVAGSDGDDRVSGGDGNDRVDGGAGRDRASGSGGNDVVLGGPDDDVVAGDGGDDRLEGGDGADDLSGGGEADVLVGGAGPDKMRGDSGEDTVDYAGRVAPLRVTNDGKADDGEKGEADNVDGSVDHAIGGAGNDLLRFATDWPHRLYGEGGNDTLDGGPKNDLLLGGPGNDQLIGRAGIDRMDGGVGNDKLSGADGTREELRCGAGKDSASRDRIDKAVGCETTRIGSAKPTSTPQVQDTASPIATTPGRRTGTKRTYARGRFVAIPGSPGERIDRRLLKDLAYLKAKYKIAITDGYARSGHSPGGEHPRGLAIDAIPGAGGSWTDIDRLARWAEPKQNRPRAPFRWIGYAGDPGHGRGHHIHLSWRAAKTKRGRPAKWVEVLSFAKGRPTVKVTNLLPLARKSNARLKGAPSVKTGLGELARCKGPGQLRSTWQKAGTAFRVNWKVLAAITDVTSGHGCNMGPTPGGQLGWTHFTADSWKVWGMDADGNGKASPYSSADAIFSTARRLRAAGAPKNYTRALKTLSRDPAFAAAVLTRSKRF